MSNAKCIGAGAILFIALFCGSNMAEAACDCEYVLEAETGTFDGAAVSPGESVCIRAGTRPFLRLSNLTGTEAAPIVVRNCEGVVTIDNSDRGYGLTIDTSGHVQLTGTGDGEELGFFIRASKDGPDYSAMGVAISGYNHNIEMDHLEVVDAGFAGFIVKTDPNCENRDLRDHVQRNIELHHNVVRNPGGEAFYLGNTGYPSRTISCDGQPTEAYPHWHEGLRVHHNRIEDTGWDGLQVSVTPSECFVYNNILVNIGTARVKYQDKGLQFGGATSCEVFGNYLQTGSNMGIFAIGSDDINIYNNVVVDFEADGIYVNLENSMPSTHRVSIVHNTIVRAGEVGIQVFGDGLDLRVQNNLVLDSKSLGLAIGNTVNAATAGNLTEERVEDFHFSNRGQGDYRLEPESPAVNAGAVQVEDWAQLDADGVPRDDWPDVGAFEYTAADRPDPAVDVGGGTSDGSDAGCGCHAADSPVPVWPAIVVILYGLLWRKPTRDSTGSSDFPRCR